MGDEGLGFSTVTNLVWLNHHAAVVTDHLAGCHDVHWPNARSETAHLLHPVQGPSSVCAQDKDHGHISAGWWGCSRYAYNPQVCINQLSVI